MPQVIQGNPRIEVHRTKGVTACPTCGHRDMVWEWAVQKPDGSWLTGEADSKNRAVHAGRTYAATLDGEGSD